MRNLGKRMRKASTASQEETGNLSELLTETFEGARVVKAYGMEGYETDRASAAVERRLTHLLKLVRTRAAATPVTETLGGVAVATVILYGGYQVIDGITTPGTFFSFIAALVMAYQPLKSLANLNTALQEGLAAAQRVFALLDVEPEIADRPGAPALKVTGGEIDLEDVSFTYRAGAPALRNVGLKVPAGRTVALVGPSGAGKSTLLNLIPRFFDASTGRVSIDGADVRGVTLASLRGAIALVSQETGLFNDTVRANIAYGRPGASEADIAAAAAAAAAHDFIGELADGYETMIGENGVRLSGGQRQRLAIARAMPRRRGRAPGARCTQAPDGRSHHPGHRPSAGDGAERRPHLRDGPGPHRRGRQPRRARGQGRGLRPPSRPPVRRGAARRPGRRRARLSALEARQADTSWRHLPARAVPADGLVHSSGAPERTLELGAR
jgi:subfamily B ATP-binding cassette protein MsbA